MQHIGLARGAAVGAFLLSLAVGTGPAAALPPTDARHASVANEAGTIHFQAGTAEVSATEQPQRNAVEVTDDWFRTSGVGVFPAFSFTDRVPLEAGPGCSAWGDSVICTHSDHVVDGFLFDLGNGNDEIFISGLEHPATVNGGLGDDRLEGGVAADAINGEAGDDFIDATAGGADTVSCGTGNDTVWVDAADSAATDCEVVQPPAKQCADGLDNDSDGKLDLADPGCESQTDDSESPDPTDPGDPGSQQGGSQPDAGGTSGTTEGVTDENPDSAHSQGQGTGTPPAADSAPSTEPGRAGVLGVQRSNPARSCRGFSRRGGRGGSPYARCVRAMANLQSGSVRSPRSACRALTRRKQPGQRQSDFARCVRVGAQLLRARP